MIDEESVKAYKSNDKSGTQRNGSELKDLWISLSDSSWRDDYFKWLVVIFPAVDYLHVL